MFLYNELPDLSRERTSLQHAMTLTQVLLLFATGLKFPLWLTLKKIMIRWSDVLGVDV